MQVRSLELENFRNYEKLKIDFDGGTNILYGDNAQGKTNLLEAVYLCAAARSHRGSRDREMVRFGCEEAHIKAFIEKNSISDRIDLHLKKSRNKGIALNGIPLRKTSELFGTLYVVLFSPEDLSIVKQGPADRRRFLDEELCQLDPVYTSALASYHRALMQKNQLLKDIPFRPELADTLDVWNEQLLLSGSEVIRRRESFLKELDLLVRGIHRDLTEQKEELSVTYEPNVSAENFRERLKENAERELRTKMSLSGPHRDDIKFSVGDMDIRTFGSQGQQRTTALSLKLSEIELIRKKTKEAPVLLLDDVLSELDRHRQLQLMERLKGIQTIVTCTGLDDFVRLRNPVSRVFFVENGHVTEHSDH